MDVTSETSIKKAVKEGIKLFKRIDVDVLVNNAGYGLFSAVETAKTLERETRFELATPTLARSCSTN
jgi:NAD(P)-dependent dehydrogenase (short-subunit alcohol dehydrogenase family)